MKVLAYEAALLGPQEGDHLLGCRHKFIFYLDMTMTTCIDATAATILRLCQTH